MSFKDEYLIIPESIVQPKTPLDSDIIELSRLNTNTFSSFSLCALRIKSLQQREINFLPKIIRTILIFRVN